MSIAAAMLRPSCKTDLTIAERQGIEIDHCPQCRDVWLDRGELNKIIERNVTAPAPRLETSAYWGWESQRDGRYGHRYKSRRRHGRGFWLHDLFG